jgi:starch phosphorylase
MSKASMKSIIPRFNAQRMVMDYVTNYYGPARYAHRSLAELEGAPAHELAYWKKRVREHWSGVTLRRVDEAERALIHGQALTIRVSANLNGLDISDVAIECLLGKPSKDGDLIVQERLPLNSEHRHDEHGELFSLEMQPRLSGLLEYQVRMYPSHRSLCHPFEVGLMVWL